MSLEAAIHDRWESWPALAALVPAERVVTGAARGEMSLPYVVLVREQEAAPVRTSSLTEVSETMVRFEIRTVELGEGKTIAQAIRQRFNRQGFALAAGTCLVMQWNSETEQAASDGTWRVAVQYVARVANSIAS